MRRSAYIVLSLAVVAWIAVAVGLGAGSPGAHNALPPSGPSPACLPASSEHSAALEGVGVDVSPAPDTNTANPDTQISFLGVPVTEIRDVAVEGSRSGYHHGHVYGYFQGDGGSFVAEKPFTAGERVAVHAVIGPAGSEHSASFGFSVATPYPASTIAGFPNPTPSPSAYQSFVSAPELHPPVLQVTSADRDPRAGDVMVTTGPGPGQYGPLIYTPQGRLVWFDPLPAGLNALNLSVQRYEGQSDLTWWQGRVLALGFGEGEDLVTDANYQTVATVRAGNGYEADLHDFQIAPDNVSYITVYNVIRCDLKPVGGVRNGVLLDTAVQEIDMKTGLVRWEWHTLDHIGVEESHTPVPNTAIPWDVAHLNSIDVQRNGDLLLSARSTWATYMVRVGSGQIAWRLGGTRSSFAMGAGTETAWQHDARMQRDGTITLFDDGSNPRIHYQSRGLRVAIDAVRRTVRLVRSYPHPEGALLADSQGNMQTLADRSVVIGWGAIPSVTELSSEGALLFDAHLPPGFSSYRAFRFPWSGHPLSPPSASARLNVTEDSTAVFASWNGASDVSSWRVLAGTSAGALTPQATMPASGFESSVFFPGTYAYVAVQALGASGELLGVSPTVAVQKPATAVKGG